MTQRKRVVDSVEQAGVDSFPASDPPGWVPMQAGSPCREPIHPDPQGRKPLSPQAAGQVTKC